MNVYVVQFDGEQDYVEAGCFGDAVALWKAMKQREAAPDEFEDEPESVVFLADRPVIREETER